VGETAAVDVQGAEDVEDRIERDVPIDRPQDDLEVLLAVLEAVEDAVEEQGVVAELTQQHAEVAAVQLDPEAPPLQVLQPPGPQVAPPVVADPPADRLFPQVTAGLLALDPLEPLRLPFTVGVHAEPLDPRGIRRPATRCSLLVPFQ